MLWVVRHKSYKIETKFTNTHTNSTVAEALQVLPLFCSLPCNKEKSTTNSPKAQRKHQATMREESATKYLRTRGISGNPVRSRSSELFSCGVRQRDKRPTALKRDDEQIGEVYTIEPSRQRLPGDRTGAAKIGRGETVSTIPTNQEAVSVTCERGVAHSAGNPSGTRSILKGLPSRAL